MIEYIKGWIDDHWVVVFIVVVAILLIAMVVILGKLEGDICNCTQCNLSQGMMDICKGTLSGEHLADFYE